MKTRKSGLIYIDINSNETLWGCLFELDISADGKDYSHIYIHTSMSGLTNQSMRICLCVDLLYYNCWSNSLLWIKAKMKKGFSPVFHLACLCMWMRGWVADWVMHYICSLVQCVCGLRNGSGYENSVTQSTVLLDHRLLPRGLRVGLGHCGGQKNLKVGVFVCFTQ